MLVFDCLVFKRFKIEEKVGVKVGVKPIYGKQNEFCYITRI